MIFEQFLLGRFRFEIAALVEGGPFDKAGDTRCTRAQVNREPDRA